MSISFNSTEAQAKTIYRLMDQYEACSPVRETNTRIIFKTSTEEVVEPIKRTKKVVVPDVPTDKPNVSDILSDWSTDDDE